MLVSWRRRQSLERAWLEALALIPEPLHPSPEQHSVILETLHEIDALLDTLKPRIKQAFLMATLDGMKQKDIALALKLAVPTVKKYIHEAYITCLSLMPDE
ncbi:putative RNA polymerase sigma factor FecI [compost metagenome]